MLLSVLTWNLCYRKENLESRVTNFCKTLVEKKPTVVALQEVTRDFLHIYLESECETLKEYLILDCDGSLARWENGWGDEDVLFGGFSRTVVYYHHLVMMVRHVDGWSIVPGSLERIMLAPTLASCKYRLSCNIVSGDGTTVHISTTHLDAYSHAESVRMQQLTHCLKTAAMKDAHATIVMGDFNLLESDKVLDSQTFGYIDAGAADEEVTFDPATNMMARGVKSGRLDRVYVKDAQLVRYLLVGNTDIVSDHYGVFVELDLSKSKLC